MKILKNSFCAVALAALSLGLASCEDETVPSYMATQEQVSASASATRSLVNALPAYFNHYTSSYVDNNNWHAPFGYGAMMIMRDLQTNDRCIGNKYNSHFVRYAYDKYMGKRYMFAAYPWGYYYGFVLATNKVLGSIDINNCTDAQKGYYGEALAFRALCYLDLARMYEFLPNDKTSSTNSDGNKVEGLTVPIVTDTLSENAARNNPRATRAEMAKFILNDLDGAEKYIGNFSDGSKTFAHLDCVYGLKARLYMWLEDYDNAAKYAKLAIDNSDVAPMDSVACLDPQKGFNQLNKWMWGSQMTSEDDVVGTGIINWTSWASNETTFGYAGAGASCLIDSLLYSKISDTDFRKKEFVGPEGPHKGDGLSYNKTSGYLDQGITDFSSLLSPYCSLKFRPANGDGDSNQTGAASAFPIMRVEEMYFIYAEALAHKDPAAGKEALVSFMRNYRDKQYTCSATSKDDVINEIILQKRIELWGEGQTFFDIKRLNMSVDRTYAHSNWLALAQFKTNGRPAWMNWVIPQSEENNNSAVAKFNNPDPSDVYTK